MKKNRKIILELLVWVTCISALLYMYINISDINKQEEVNSARLKHAEHNVYSELFYNQSNLEQFILDDWNEFNAHVNINAKHLTVTDLDRRVFYFNLTLKQFDLLESTSWDYLKHSGQALLMDSFVFKRVADTYNRQKALKDTAEKLLKAYADMVPHLKQTDAINLNDPIYFDFDRHLNEIDSWINLMPTIYTNAKYVLDSERHNEEINAKKDSINNPGLFYKEKLNQYRIQLLSSAPVEGRTKDSIQLAIEVGMQTLAQNINQSLTEDCCKLNIENYRYIIEKKENKILVLVNIPQLGYVPLELRKQILATIQERLDVLNLPEKQDYYIGVFANEHLAMAAIPGRTEDSGIYANPDILLWFYINP